MHVFLGLDGSPVSITFLQIMTPHLHSVSVCVGVQGPWSGVDGAQHAHSCFRPDQHCPPFPCSPVSTHAPCRERTGSQPDLENWPVPWQPSGQELLQNGAVPSQ